MTAYLSQTVSDVLFALSMLALVVGAVGATVLLVQVVHRTQEPDHVKFARGRAALGRAAERTRP